MENFNWLIKLEEKKGEANPFWYIFLFHDVCSIKLWLTFKALFTSYNMFTNKKDLNDETWQKLISKEDSIRYLK